MIFFKITFHYIDLITDIMLIHTIKEIEAHELATSGKKTIEINSFMDANLLIIFLLTERVMSLIDLLDLLK